MLRKWVMWVAVCFVVAAGCSSDGEGGDDSGDASGGDASGGSAASGGASGTTGAEGGVGGGGASATGGVGADAGIAASGGSAGSAGTGGTGGVVCHDNSECTAPLICSGGRCISCTPAKCQGLGPYQCGDCADNDGDQLTDMADPDCLGPCHNAEHTYTGCIPGQQQAACKADCYFDKDSGDGNDQCTWDHRCDPLGVDGSESGNCPYGCASDGCNPATVGAAECVQQCSDSPPAATRTCSEMYDSQSVTCESFCGPLTPNGCDCFGCCELPAASGRYVYLGSTSDDSGRCEHGTCTREAAEQGDSNACKPCTPVAACLNTCDECECCLGMTAEQCAERARACEPPDAGTGGSGGEPPCPTPFCTDGMQPCGVPCLPECPRTSFCLTGCCVPIPH